ncbi:MAG: ATP-dependent helicase [Spirochaetia bacterium]|jgi:superfamily I DNA/RNA helicase|nr:ATP-dependent helicase [Spirochaetia bacterium]
MYNFTEEQNIFLKAEGNIVLQACPGSGKTTSIAKKFVQYVENWKQPHQGVAILSFTNVASEEVKQQVQEMILPGFDTGYPHYLGTLDSFINKYILLRFGYLLYPEPKRPIISLDDLFLLPFFQWKSECYRKGCVTNISSFRWDKNGRLLYNNENIRCKKEKGAALPCEQYKKLLLKKGLIFQSETASFAYLLLKKHPNIAAAIATRFPVIIVDEAQDSSAEQMAVLDLINQAGTKSMFLIGDPDQSIYEWRNATPKCFRDKIDSDKWRTLRLTGNFRSSQLICNVTRFFSKSLEGTEPSKAIGSDVAYSQEPILLLYEGNIKNNKGKIIEKFREICIEHAITIDASHVAIVTRGRISSNREVSGLWKSPEVKFFANASYEWMAGSRKKAYEFCEKGLFGLIIKGYKDIQDDFRVEIENCMPYEFWHSIVVELLIKLPSANLPLSDWVKRLIEQINKLCCQYNLTLLKDKTIQGVIKIKKRDQKVKDFKTIPLKSYFETINQSSYTESSVHGVKGQTYDALMLLVGNNKGNTITSRFLCEGSLDTELMRIAYVAMTRPRKLLVIAMPKIENQFLLSRFSISNWEYIYV